MKKRKDTLRSILLIMTVFLLVYQNEIVKEACADGIRLCVMSVIPSLFPFFCITAPTVSIFSDNRFAPVRRIGSLCGMPEGTDGILVMGLLGGYPMGAKAVKEAYDRRIISQKNAQRLLGFCSNCGPAFFLGIISGLFQSFLPGIALWLIHMMSAICVGMILPGKSNQKTEIVHKENCKIDIQNSVSSMANVCGWIILFRILIIILEKCLIVFPFPVIPAFFAGLLEITNGIYKLQTIDLPSLRFLLAGLFVSFGGVCVIMQTSSVIGSLNLQSYILGKGLQIGISSALSGLFCLFYWKKISYEGVCILMLSVLIGALSLFLYRKKYVVFHEKMMYNEGNLLEMGMKDSAVS